ncbi:hypothetical protein EDD21DRAFT_90547 [Dissophora ornata]|nr:hypothetical protein BGZ58_011003 [Dissophora ornata]KAI8594397.1 hypothetical protein EDD21DRAFT_90547 [Dissophora ornata]
MSLPTTISTFAEIPSSTKNMRLSIQVHGNEMIDIDSKRLSVFYGTLESPAVIYASVIFETDQGCSANDVEVTYNACASFNAPVFSFYTAQAKSDDTFQKKRWLMDLDRPAMGKVAPGSYVKEVSATIDPLWPSSARTAIHANGHGWVKYVFEAKLIRQLLGMPNVLLVASQEVWVLNSTLPAPSTGNLMGLGNPSPLIVRDSWKKSTLPVSITLPSDALTMAQVVPITVKMGSLTGKFAGQTIVVMSAHFALRELVYGRANGHDDVQYDFSYDVITVPLNDGWLRTAGPWERTVNLTMPTTPQVAASAKTKWMDIMHSLVLVMKIKAESEKDRKAEQFELKADVQIVVPRHTPESNEDFLPTYSLASPGQESLRREMLPAY